MKHLIILLSLLQFCLTIRAIELPTVQFNTTRTAADTASLRIMFWNVENLFDTIDNPLTLDDEFLPTGARRWTPRRYRRKQRNLAQTIIECGGWMRGDSISAWRPVDIVGLAEVENEEVLRDLLRRTPLSEAGYTPIITHSADVRGINVAILYRSEHFQLLGSEEWEVALPEGSRPTRHMLHVWGVSGDTIDIVVCHLPSRYGGAVATIPSRRAAHICLSEHIDSLEHTRAALRLLVMGDMNDYPDTPLLGAGLHLQRPPRAAVQTMPPVRYNLMQTLQARKKPIAVMGSHKYQGEWGYLDQFFATGRLLEYVRAWGVFATPAMLTEDVTHMGLRPKRSYYGFSYEGGYSDHLPIWIDLHSPIRAIRHE